MCPKVPANKAKTRAAHTRCAETNKLLPSHVGHSHQHSTFAIQRHCPITHGPNHCVKCAKTRSNCNLVFHSNWVVCAESPTIRGDSIIFSRFFKVRGSNISHFMPWNWTTYQIKHIASGSSWRFKKRVFETPGTRENRSQSGWFTLIRVAHITWDLFQTQ